MSEFIPWSSQPIEDWSARHAPGSTIELGGHRTHYIEKGAGEPVILLHGFFYDSASMWSANIDALASRYKVYALDLWGCGYSTREPLDYGYPLFAEQLLQFMDRLGIARASLIGQSMGAGTAIRFCVEHRERVERLLLVSAAGLPNPLPPIARFFNLPRIGEFFARLKTDAIRTAGLKGVFIHDPTRVTPSYVEEVTRAQKIAGSVEVGLTMQRGNVFDKLGDEIHRLGELDVPTLLVWGRHDKAIPLRLGEEMHRILRGSRLAVLDGAGHVANFEQAERFNMLALEFLAEREPVPAAVPA
jgi:pimeloyl-ACP methyl ester carboxylesterase